jgi:RNase adaptor protein for sRNA GlmZ degradation
MSDYLIESVHTSEECLAELDTIVREDPKVFDTLEFGCMSGEHRAVAIVRAEDERRALGLLPAAIRSRAKVTQLSKFTPQQVRMFHEQHK